MEPTIQWTEGSRVASPPGSSTPNPSMAGPRSGLLAPGGATGPVVVQIGRENANRELTATQVEIPPVEEAGGLAVLTPAWVFDEDAVGAQCVPPAGQEPVNTTVPPETDLLGGVVGDKPALPAPGEPPADVPSATQDVLDTIRAVYALDNVYDEAKAELMEDPILGLEILRALRANAVVEPYLSALDPEFDSVSFINPTQARVLYRVGPSYHWSIGRVDLVNGRWRVMLGTVCRDLSDAGYSCPAVTNDPRPGPLG